ncbi:MAG TPA: S41 family peptidase [Candidatus Limnocylindrales bacterium]|nr:S41 family peptidase [Candidatus Limnocylindrales bacterium]
MLGPSATPPGFGAPQPPPAPPSGGRPSWSDGTFLVVVLLLIVAFLSGIVLGGSGLLTATGGVATAPSGSPGASQAVGTLGPGHTMPADAPADFGLFWTALATIQEHFVDRSALDPQKITYGAIEGLVDALGDPGHTVFLTPEEVKADQQALDGSIVGIGVYLSVQAGQPIIQSVISGTPAAKAGVRSGDLLIAVDGKTANGLSTEQIADLVRGQAGTKVTITVIHPDTTNPVDITITRARISVPAVSWAMVPGTKDAMVRVIQFSQGASKQVVQALKAAQAAGARGIVLDLRSDPGGLVDEAVSLTSQFIGTGDVYVRQLADGSKIPVPVQSGGTALKTPVVVLVDYGTASAAEIVAGALQDADRAKVVGTRTFGTGTVLNTFDLPDGSALRLAVEEWLTPSGRHIFPSGITPDDTVDLAPGVVALEPDDIRTMSPAQLQAADDAQLARAISILAGGQ